MVFKAEWKGYLLIGCGSTESILGTTAMGSGQPCDDQVNVGRQSLLSVCGTQACYQGRTRSVSADSLASRCWRSCGFGSRCWNRCWHWSITGAIPVGIRITQTLTDSHRLVSMAVHRSQNVICQIVNSLVVNVVLNLQETVCSRIGWIDCLIPDILGILD